MTFGYWKTNIYITKLFNHIAMAKTELLYLKCGGIGSNGFHIKGIIGTHDNWKNQNPGGRFGATI